MPTNTQIEKVLKALIFIGLFGILFIPFLVDRSMFFPFITGKGFTFRIIVEIIAALWIVLFLLNKQYRPKFSWIFGALLAFLVSLSISAIFSENPSKSFWSNYERMEGLITILHLVVFFAVMSSVLSTQKLWIRFFNTSLVASLGIAIYGVLQLMGKFPINQGGVRVDATFGNATYLAIYLVFHIFIALFLLIRTRGNSLRLAYGLLIPLLLFVLYETQTRGAILGLIGGIFLSACLVVFKEKENKILRNISLGIIGGLIFLVLGFITIKDSAFVKNNPTLVRFAEISLSNTPNQARYYVWPMAIKGFLERPIFGWGQESFNYVFNKHYDPRMYNQETWFDRTHNAALDWLVAGGIFGSVLYLSLFWLGIKYLWRVQTLSSSDKSILTGLFAAYFFHNLFVFDNLTSYLMFFSVLAFIHSLAAKDWDLFSFDVKERGIQTTSAVTAILLLFILYTANIIPIQTNKALIQAISPQKDSNFGLNLEYFKKALAYNSFGSPEIREQLSLTATTLVRNPSIPNDIKVQFANLSAQELEKHLALTPNDTRYQLFAAVSFNAFGSYDKGKQYATQATQSSPKKQTAYFELGTSYLGKKEYDKSLEVFKTAYELEPSFLTAKIIYAMGAIYAGDKKLEQELLVSLPQEVLYFDNRILQAYAAKGEYVRALEILGKRIELDPQDTGNRLSRAGIYLQIGNRSLAIADIEEVIQLNPEFKNQGEYYINEIRAGRNP
ncbi:MAG: O-antigen ligase family protein [bacterium]|nr:O-antigen ligase family protein [bacterium]